MSLGLVNQNLAMSEGPFSSSYCFTLKASCEVMKHLEELIAPR